MQGANRRGAWGPRVKTYIPKHVLQQRRLLLIFSKIRVQVEETNASYEPKLLQRLASADRSS